MEPSAEIGGLFSVTLESGRGSIYKSIGYTERALMFMEDGGLWKTGEKHAALFSPLK